MGKVIHVRFNKHMLDKKLSNIYDVFFQVQVL